MEEQERILERLAELGFSPEAIRKYIEAQPGAGYIRAWERKYNDNDYVLYQLDLDREENLLVPKGYHAHLIRVPELAHGTFDDIDTLQLEKRIRAIDWEYSAFSTHGPDSEIRKVFDDLDKLFKSGDNDGAEIANDLRKHYIFPEHTSSLPVTSYYFELNGSFADFHTRQSYNLLCGRAVVKFEQSIDRPLTFLPRWAIIQKGNLIYLPEYGFGTKIKELGLHEMKISYSGLPLLDDLIRGERCLVHLTSVGRIIPVYLETDPLNQGFRFYDFKGNRVKHKELVKTTSPADQQTNAPEQNRNRLNIRKPGKNRGL